MIVLDIETNLDHDIIWCAVTWDEENGLRTWTEDNNAFFQDYLRRSGYDLQEHMLRKLTPAQSFRYQRNKLQSRYGETALWSLARKFRQAMK